MAASKHDLTMLEETQHTPSKKRGQPLTHDDSVFLEFPETLVKGLADILNHWLLDKNSFTFKTLTALKILNCNAADPRQGNSFSQIFCSVEPYHQLHPLGDIFTKGLFILTDFMTGRKVPQNTQEKHVLGKLLSFMTKLMEEAEQAPMQNLERYNESELTIVLANHLFAKLTTSETFIMNKHSKFKRNVICPCGITTCTLTGLFGDTSVGNCKVWHGNLDIIINNEIALEPLAHCLPDKVWGQDYSNDDDDTSAEEDDSSDDYPSGKSPNEVKEFLSRKSEILAETIVFSFLQKQRHADSEHFLFPCIGVTGRNMVIYLYDSQHDVLLESSSIPLLSESLTALGQINSFAIVVAWLVVNYKCLGSGLTQDMKTAKAMFFSQAKPKLNIYESMLKLGDVGNAYRIEEAGKDFLPPKPTSILEQLNERVLKLRYGTESTEGNSSVETE